MVYFINSLMYQMIVLLYLKNVSFKISNVEYLGKALFTLIKIISHKGFKLVPH